MAVGPQETVLYPLGSRALTVLVVVVALVVEGSLIAYGHADVLLRATPAVLLVAVGAVVLFWLPRVELDPAELRVVNPVRTVRISWPAIERIDTRWSLTLETVRGRVTAWAAPAPGLFSQMGRLRRSALSQVSLGERSAPRGAEQARRLVMQQWEHYRESGVLGAVEGAGVVTRWHGATIAVLVVLAAATVAGAVWP